MASFVRRVFLVLLLGMVAGPACAELPLATLRDKFESALETEKLEFGTKKLKLRDGYVGALERLKVTLGGEGKLEEAAQVLAEVEKARQADPEWEMPDNADHRFKALRSKWVSAHEKLVNEHRANVAKLSKVYLRLLEDRKNSFTRAGKIKDALAADEEMKRVGALPTVMEALGTNQSAETGTVAALKERLELTRWSWRDVEVSTKGYSVAFEKGGKVTLSWKRQKGSWEVRSETSVEVLSADWEKPMILEFTEDQEEFQGRWLRSRRLKVTGVQLGEK